ncbi:hypothetical protein M231_06256 [Tremella mesenterica]|uniref:Uncharacterized protein n=1 Tax=Tremella mesenterica TaxID=5217 RepID=A0A4Q1BCB4_TREME|nr:hypothetical protein M231_06256 [Tremella mesenterica]
MMAHAASHPRMVLSDMTGAQINHMEQHFVEPHLLQSPPSQYSQPLQHHLSELQWELYKVDIRTSGRVIGCQYNFRHKVTGQYSKSTKAWTGGKVLSELEPVKVGWGMIFC